MGFQKPISHTLGVMSSINLQDRIYSSFLINACPKEKQGDDHIGLD